MNDLFRQGERHIWRPFTQAKTALPAIAIRSAQGAKLYSADGREFLDMISSWWVNLHGHAHPAIANAIARQANLLEHALFADFSHEPAIRLASRIANELSGDLQRIFYSDNGSTAVEVALKIAYQYWKNQGNEKPIFIAFEGGYHGDTFGAMAAGAASGFFDSWRDLLFSVEFIPFPYTWEGDHSIAEREQSCLQKWDELATRYSHRICAAIVEPLVQGAAGMRMCRPEFLQIFAQRVRASQALLIFDEVMTGFGRTGSLFALKKAGVKPDILCLSKGLTGGFLPLAMTVCSDFIYEQFLGNTIQTAFLHGHSYTANPLGCAAALASLDLLMTPECSNRIRTIETIHRARLASLIDKLASNNRGFHRPRVTGTIAAWEIAGHDNSYGSLNSIQWKSFFLNRGIFLRPMGNVFYFMPPYCISEDELNLAWDVVEEFLFQE